MGPRMVAGGSISYKFPGVEWIAVVVVQRGLMYWVISRASLYVWFIAMIVVLCNGGAIALDWYAARCPRKSKKRNVGDLVLDAAHDGTGERGTR